MTNFLGVNHSRDYFTVPLFEKFIPIFAILS